VRQLHVFHGGAVFVFALYGTNIHAYLLSMYLLCRQAANQYSCAYAFWPLDQAAMNDFDNLESLDG